MDADMIIIGAGLAGLGAAAIMATTRSRAHFWVGVFSQAAWREGRRDNRVSHVFRMVLVDLSMGWRSVLDRYSAACAVTPASNCSLAKRA